MTRSLYEITGRFGNSSERGFVCRNAENFDEALKYAEELGLLSVNGLVIKKFNLTTTDSKHKIIDIQTKEYIAA